MTQILQNIIIEKLNNYLMWHNLPIHMNEHGICNGLAAVYVKYVLDDRQDEFEQMLYQIAVGGKESFDTLLRNEQCKDWFNEHFLRKENAKSFIQAAAQGGKVELLKEIIEFYRTQGKPTPLSNKEIAECISFSICFKKLLRIENGSNGIDAINIAISASTDSVPNTKLLLEHLDTADIKLNEKQLLAYLHHSIIRNQPQLVELFLDKIEKTLSKEDQGYLFKSINLHLITVDRTDISILRMLKTTGVEFSRNAQYIINKKEKRPTGHLLSIGVTLNLFTDFVKEFLPRDSEAQKSIRKFYKFKSRDAQAGKELGENPKNEHTP